MWITVDGRLNTVAVPTNRAALAKPRAALRRAALSALRSFDPWAEGGVAESAREEVRDRRGWSIDDEAEYETVAIPDEIVASFRWDRVVDVNSALRELGKVDPRWRLDVALILEDLVVEDE